MVIITLIEWESATSMLQLTWWQKKHLKWVFYLWMTLKTKNEALLFIIVWAIWSMVGTPCQDRVGYSWWGGRCSYFEATEYYRNHAFYFEVPYLRLSGHGQGERVAGRGKPETVRCGAVATVSAASMRGDKFTSWSWLIGSLCRILWRDHSYRRTSRSRGVACATKKTHN